MGRLNDFLVHEMHTRSTAPKPRSEPSPIKKRDWAVDFDFLDNKPFTTKITTPGDISTRGITVRTNAKSNPTAAPKDKRAKKDVVGALTPAGRVSHSNTKSDTISHTPQPSKITAPTLNNISTDDASARTDEKPTPVAGATDRHAKTKDVSSSPSPAERVSHSHTNIVPILNISQRNDGFATLGIKTQGPKTKSIAIPAAQAPRLTTQSTDNSSTVSESSTTSSIQHSEKAVIIIKNTGIPGLKTKGIAIPVKYESSPVTLAKKSATVSNKTEPQGLEIKKIAIPATQAPRPTQQSIEHFSKTESSTISTVDPAKKPATVQSKKSGVTRVSGPTVDIINPVERKRDVASMGIKTTRAIQKRELATTAKQASRALIAQMPTAVAPTTVALTAVTITTKPKTTSSATPSTKRKRNDTPLESNTKRVKFDSCPAPVKSAARKEVRGKAVPFEAKTDGT